MRVRVCVCVCVCVIDMHCKITRYTAINLTCPQKREKRILSVCLSVCLSVSLSICFLLSSYSCLSFVVFVYFFRLCSQVFYIVGPYVYIYSFNMSISNNSLGKLKNNNKGRKCFISRRTQHILFTVIWRRTFGKGQFR